MSQGKETTKEKTFKELKPLGRRKETPGRPGHFCRGFRV